MSENFEGKVALVTGGAMGLGKAITKLLLSEGCRVAFADMNQLAGEKTQQEFQAIYGADRIKFIICDVTNDEAFEDCFREVKRTFGRLDITVNNAGFAVESRWRKIFEINTMAVYFGTLLALKYMGKDHGGDGGFVINIASIAGLVVCPVIPAYNASKYGVIGLTRAFGTDFYYSRTGVRVSCLCPEPIETDLWRGISNFCQEIKVNSPYITENYGKQIQKVKESVSKYGSYKVAIVDNRKEAGENAQRDLAKSFGRDNVIFLQCDVTNEEEFENAFIEAINKLGKLNIVVNSAGVAELPNWRKVYAINTMAVYSGNLLGLKHMDKSRGWEGGHIVNVASITGFMACPPVPSYASAKAAVISFTRAFGSDIFFKRTGVTVNCICPDAMDTPLLKGLLDACVHGGPDAIAVGKYFQESILDPEKVALGVIKLIEERVNGAALIALRTKEFVYRKFDM